MFFLRSGLKFGSIYIEGWIKLVVTKRDQNSNGPF